MLFLMLNLRFKSLWLVSFAIGWKHVVPIVKEYGKWSLIPLFLKCYYIFHSMVEFGLVLDMEIDEKNSLDIFEMWTNEGGGEQGVTTI